MSLRLDLSSASGLAPLSTRADNVVVQFEALSSRSKPRTELPGGASIDPAAAVDAVSMLAASDASGAQGLVGNFLALEALTLFHGGADRGATSAAAKALRALSRPPIDAQEGHFCISATSAHTLRIVGRQPLEAITDSTKLIVVVIADPDAGGGFALVLPVTEDRLRVVRDARSFGQQDASRGFVEIEGDFLAKEMLPLDKEHFAKALFRLTLLAELLHLAVDHGIIVAFLARARDHLRTRTRPWPETGVESGSDDPHIIRRYGEIVAHVHALSELVSEATGAAAKGNAVDAIAIARAYADRLGKEIVNNIIELLGASSVSQRFGFDAFWRDLATHALHEPPFWPLERIGEGLIEANRATPHLADRGTLK